jgi:hypothetical protein
MDILKERPMSGINDREKGFENKFAHDQELEFKAAARLATARQQIQAEG